MKAGFEVETSIILKVKLQLAVLKKVKIWFSKMNFGNVSIFKIPRTLE